MNWKWDARFMAMAKLVSTWSKDPSTKCGAVIVRGKHVVSLGFNGFPSGCLDNDHLYNNRELKYARVIHAEINAILKAGEDLTGCTLYVYPFMPCSQCAAAVIQSGIKRVVTHEPTDDQLTRWYKSFEISLGLFRETFIPIVYVKESKP